MATLKTVPTKAMANTTIGNMVSTTGVFGELASKGMSNDRRWLRFEAGTGADRGGCRETAPLVRFPVLCRVGVRPVFPLDQGCFGPLLEHDIPS